jgi:hypothetical protein
LINAKDIVERLTIQDRDVLLSKYHLQIPKAHKDLKFYNRRGAVLGQVGRIYRNKTTGPCLLGISDIDRIKKDPDSFKGIIQKQPTLQNVLNVGYQSFGEIRICLETHEFASLARDVFGVDYDFALEEFKGAATRTQRIIKRLHKKGTGKLHFYYTHQPKVDKRLREITQKNHQRFLELMSRKAGERKVLVRIRKQMEAGKDPNDIFKLRIYSTYTPGWWGGNIKSHTIVENIYNINTYIDPDLNPSWVALVPLRSLEWKREMAQGSCVYVGASDDVENAIEHLSSQVPKKSPYHCNVGNILPYVVEDGESLDTLVECFQKRDLDSDRCKRCLGIVQDFLRRISDMI